jgi:hypothetical protein
MRHFWGSGLPAAALNQASTTMTKGTNNQSWRTV